MESEDPDKQPSLGIPCPLPTDDIPAALSTSLTQLFAPVSDHVSCHTLPPLPPETADPFALAKFVRTKILAAEDDAPLSPERLSTLTASLGAELRFAPLSDSTLQGAFLPLSDGRSQIVVDPTPPLGWHDVSPHLRWEVAIHRSRFVLSHEIGHALLRHFGARHFRLQTASQREHFCDDFARSLLLPPAAAVRMPLHPTSIVQLHDHFGVSVSVAARSMFHAKVPAYVAVLVRSQDSRKLFRPHDPCFPQHRFASYKGPFRPHRWWASDAIRKILDRGEGELEIRRRSLPPIYLHALYLRERNQLIATSVGPTTSGECRVR